MSKITQKKDCKSENIRSRAFTLIELIVATFIFIVIMGAMLSIAISFFQAYQKSRAIKTVAEEIEFTLNSIAKDMRMGKITNSINNPVQSSVVFMRNQGGGQVCYKIVDTKSLGLCDANCVSCNPIIDLSKTNMEFDMTTSGFRYQRTDIGRGWVEINLNIENPSMDTDSIRSQTTLSSRDYGI